MPKRKSICQFASQHRVVCVVAGQLVVLATLALLLLGNGFFTHTSNVFAAACTSSGQTYAVRGGDTLAVLTGSSNLIFADQHTCLPGNVVTVEKQPASANDAALAFTRSRGRRGTSNNFPYGQCTWWADQRYHQLTGAYVPWTSNADAYQWASKASQYHWKVSSMPKRGSIMMLSVGVEGAFGDGHVAVVERLLGGGRVMVSEMNWGGRTGVVTYSTFTAAQGVYFISIN